VLEAVDQALPLDTSRVKYITAFDSSYKGSKQYTVIVVYSLVDSRVVEKIHASVDVKAPYILGLLVKKYLGI
jgi:deoxyinosine 3'endonuclease (endonuclease V)